mgnify:CR=1 FL=1
MKTNNYYIKIIDEINITYNIKSTVLADSIIYMFLHKIKEYKNINYEIEINELYKLYKINIICSKINIFKVSKSKIIKMINEELIKLENKNILIIKNENEKKIYKLNKEIFKNINIK